MRRLLRSHGLWPKLALLAGSFGLTVGVLEVLFRIAAISSPDLSADAIWRTQSEVRVPRHSEWVRIGRLEFREDWVPSAAADSNTWRLLLLGDSFTEGSGIALDQDRFSDRIERALNRELEELGSSRRVRVFNAGKGATYPHHWVRYYKTLQPLYQPDLVIAVFFLRDGAPLSTSLRFNRAIIDPIRRRYESLPLHGRSALLRFVYNRLAWRDYTLDFKRRLVSAYLGSEQEQETWRTEQAALLEIAEDCRSKGIPFHLVLFPLLLQLDDYEFFEVEEAIADFARSHAIPSFSLTPGFLGEDERTLWVASNDQHPNEKGHRLAAETLLPYVRTLLPRDGIRQTPVRDGTP